MLNIAIFTVLIAGSAIYFYFYQVWPQRRWRADGLRIRGDRGFSLFYRYLQISTPVYTWLSVRRNVAVMPASISWCGLCIAACSIGLFVWAMRSLNEQYSHCFDSYVADELVDRGPYALLRHPIYVANCAMLAGLFLATGAWGILMNASVLGAFYYRAARREETALARHLPGYAAYLQRTRMTRGVSSVVQKTDSQETFDSAAARSAA